MKKIISFRSEQQGQKPVKSAHIYFATFSILLCFTLVLALSLLDSPFSQAAGNAYPPDTTLTPVTVPSIPRPGYPTPITDPNFGTQVMRIGDKTVFGSAVTHHRYAKDQARNSDGTLVKLQANPTAILDGRTFQFLRAINTPPDTVWFNHDPTHLFAVNGSGKQVLRIDAVTGASTILRTESECNSLSLGFGEGNISNDDRYAALICAKGASSYTFMLYDIPNNAIVATKDVTTTSALDWVSVSPSGNYILANWTTYGTGQYHGVELYDQNFNFIRQVYYQDQHGDMGYDGNGREVYVQYDDDINVLAFDLAAGTQRIIMNQNVQGSISCRNINRPGWCYVTAYVRDGSIYDEVFALKLDGSMAVERFANHRSSGYTYDASPLGTPNRDGSMVMFASDWNTQTTPIYSYVAWMPSSGQTPSPTPTPTITSTPSPTPIAGGATLTASPTTTSPTGSVTACWNNVTSPRVDDWIGVYVPGTANNAYLNWLYTSSCTQSTGTTAKVSGNCNVTMPATPGTYELRLFVINTNIVPAATSPAITVTNISPTPTSTPTPIPDTQTPTVPAGLTATAVSSSQINLAWTASTDNVGVTGYDVYRGGSLLTAVAGTSFQNTGLAPNTTYSYQVRAKDAAGNTSALSGSVSATTLAASGDTTLPTVSITSPANNATVARKSNVTITATAADNAGVTNVEFLVNNSLTCTDTASPYSCVWRVPNTRNVRYTLAAKAYDAAGNTATSSITVTSQ